MKTLVIIPTYNEIENIEKLINSIFLFVPQVEILIIDDNSTDGTNEYISKLTTQNKRVHKIHREKKLGLGSAYKMGFEYAVEKNYDYIFEMDADFSHNPADLPKFLEKMGDWDLVIGSRYINGISVINWPISRLLLSCFANLYARVITGVPVKDLTSGFKCYKREVIKEILYHKIHSDGYGFQIETVFWAYRKNFKIYEMSIIFIDRVLGRSKMTKEIVREAFWLVWKLRIFSILKRK